MYIGLNVLTVVMEKSSNRLVFFNLVDRMPIDKKSIPNVYIVGQRERDLNILDIDGYFF